MHGKPRYNISAIGQATKGLPAMLGSALCDCQSSRRDVCAYAGHLRWGEPGCNDMMPVYLSLEAAARFVDILQAFSLCDHFVSSYGASNPQLRLTLVHGLVTTVFPVCS